MNRDLQESLDRPLDHFQEAGLPTSSPMQSTGLRKSVNWARPLVTSMLKKAVKRGTMRLSGKEFARTTPSSGAIEPKENVREMIDSFVEDRPIRFITCGTKHRGRKHEAAVAGPQELLKEESGRLQLEPQQDLRSCSKEQSDSKTLKKARIAFFRDDQLEGNLGIEAEKEWVSVPLDTMEGEEDICRNQGCVNPGADESTLRPSNNESTKTAEVRRHVSFCSFNKESQDRLEEKIPESSKMKADVDNYATVNKELCEYLSQFLAGAKTVMQDVEHVIHDLWESQLKALRAENKRIVETAALEQERLRNNISELSRKNLKILEEKSAIEHEIDYRENLRLEIEKKHGETAEALRMELGKEQDKTACQICFNSHRDAIVLPCMHFLYCNDCLEAHQRRQQGCPTCRAKINGVLRCNLSCTS